MSSVIFEVRTYNATNIKGKRFRIFGSIGSKKFTIVNGDGQYFAYDYYYNDTTDQALAILKDQGYSEDQITNVKDINNSSNTTAIIYAQRW